MSNLLDLASIVLTPTAYNNGEALCIKPDDGSGDFQFSRNSAATRVNAQGLVENVQILSSNLVQNGDFSEEGVQEVSNGSFSQEGVEQITNGDFENGSTGWNFQLGWTFDNGQAHFENLGSSNRNLWQSPLVNGNWYKLTFEITAITSGYIRNVNSSVTDDTQFSTIGVHTQYFQAANVNLYLKASVDANLSIDNVSCVEVGQNWTFGTGWSVGEDKVVGDGTMGANVFGQNVGFTQGNTYKFSFTIEDYISGSIYIREPFNGYLEPVNSNGDFSFYYVAGASNQLDFRGNSFNGSITNISVKEVGQNWSFTSGATLTDIGAKITHTPTAGSIAQLSVLTIGKQYKLTYEITESISGGLKFNSAVDASMVTTVGVHTKYFEADGTTAVIGRTSATDNDVTITNISVKEVGQNWDLNTGWEIGDGVAVATSGAASKLTQSISGLSGKKCSVTFTLSNYGGNGTIKLDFGSVVGQNINANGTYTEVGTYDIDRLEFFKNSSFSGSIDNVSVIEITTDTSLPRINYEGFSYDGSGNVVPDSGCGSWLFEPQSTNLVPYSEDFSQWDVINTPIITSNYGVSPDGTQNADRLQMNTNDRIYTSVPASGNTAFSVYLKGSGIITLRDSTNVYRQDVTLTSEWERYSLYFNATSNTVQIQNQKVGDVDCEIWGAQVEALSYPTSYIPTSGSTVTRNQDVCNNGGSLASINSTEGVLYFEGSALVGGSNTQISLSDGTNDNGVKLRFDLNPDRLTIFLRGNSGTFAIKTITGVTQTDNNKIALVWDITNFRIWINGTEQGLIATNDLPIGLDTLNFANNTGSSNFQGKTKAVAVWKEALSDEELAELTTI